MNHIRIIAALLCLLPLTSVSGAVAAEEEAIAPDWRNARIAFTRGVDQNGDGVIGGGTPEELTADIFLKTYVDGVGRETMVNRSNALADIDPAFSPDGRRLAWSTNDTPTGSFDIVVKDLRTGVFTNLTRASGANERWPSWSHDGRKLLYSRGSLTSNLDVWVMNANGSDQRYAAGKPGAGKYLEDCCASFLPGDTQIVFASNRTGNFDIYRYPLVSPPPANEQPGFVVRLTTGPEYEGTPSVSPTGSILYRHGEMGYWLQPFATPGTGKPIRIAGHVRTPTSSTDGRHLAFGWFAKPGAQLDLVVTYADGSKPVNLTNSPFKSELHPTWTRLTMR